MAVVLQVVLNQRGLMYALFTTARSADRGWQ
jgi:hypothetical protein